MKLIKFIIVVVLFSLLTACKEDSIMMDYPGLTDKKHIFEEINVDELLKMINEDETFVAVLGFPECPWCRAIMPHLNDAGKEEGLKEIYYVNILEMREETSSDHAKYLELKEYLDICVDKEKDRVNAPTTIGVKCGELTDYNLDTVASHVKEENELPPLTDEQVLELKEILKRIIKSTN